MKSEVKLTSKNGWGYRFGYENIFDVRTGEKMMHPLRTITQKVTPRSDFFHGRRAATTRPMKTVTMIPLPHQGIKEKVLNRTMAIPKKTTASEVTALTTREGLPVTLHCCMMSLGVRYSEKTFLQNLQTI